MLLNDHNQCKKDGLCAAVCPVGLIEMDAAGFPVEVADADERCIRCGHCVAICSEGCLQHQDLDPADIIPIDAENVLSADQCRQFLQGRRSIRKFRDRSVENVVIQQLLAIASHAPSGHNSQGVQWLVLSQKEELSRLAGVVADWMRFMLEKMPDIAAQLHMETVLDKFDDGEDVILRDAPVVIVAHAPDENKMAPVSCTLGLAYLELAAYGLGLGACWAGYFNAAATTFPAMQQALTLPEGNRANGAMMLGYPRYRYLRIPPRNEPQVIWR